MELQTREEHPVESLPGPSVIQRWWWGLCLCATPLVWGNLAWMAIAWINNELPGRGVPETVRTGGVILVALLGIIGVPLLTYEYGYALLLPARQTRYRLPGWGQNVPRWLGLTVVVIAVALGIVFFLGLALLLVGLVTTPPPQGR